jgi:hypothetical protein
MGVLRGFTKSATKINQTMVNANEKQLKAAILMLSVVELFRAVMAPAASVQKAFMRSQPAHKASIESIEMWLAELEGGLFGLTKTVTAVPIIAAITVA